MSDKAKLPKESAEAIELMRAKGAPNNEIVERHINEDHIRVNGYGNVQSLSTDTLIRALYIGYEVEQTALEWIAEEYGKHVVCTNEWSKGYCKGLEMAIERLGIKIDGINT